MVTEYKKKGGRIIGSNDSIDSNKENEVEKSKNIEKKKQKDIKNNDDYNSDDTDSDYDVDKMLLTKSKKDKIGNKDNSQTISEYIV